MPEHSEHSEQAEHRHTGARGYLLTWLALLALTVLSFTVSEVHLGRLDVVIMLAIATFKATLVVLIFMHLLEVTFANRMVVLLSAFFVFLLVSLMVADVMTRKTFPAAPQAPEQRTDVAAPSAGPRHP
jgi:cytochrome c oxidase subunit 4